MVASAFIGSRLDYCNSLIKSFSAAGLRKLQYIQNSLATIDYKATKYLILPISHITGYPFSNALFLKWHYWYEKYLK